ncbi:hypothetical protein EVAR_6361_1 [Eumeta japonica]|uniref:Uncharacterized protein n=1 Tax=Eumeta variegata TaxID=151549 RepID=A0A4C1TCD7_EUMVA|nr:hypothetical protein EVAR_6361_1 [Eumeta japonica]
MRTSVFICRVYPKVSLLNRTCSSTFDADFDTVSASAACRAFEYYIEFAIYFVFTLALDSAPCAELGKSGENVVEACLPHAI